jgi:hypothetical protein
VSYDPAAAIIWQAATPEQIQHWEAEEGLAEAALAKANNEEAERKKRLETALKRDAIRQWLLLGPIPLAELAPKGQALEKGPLPGEAQLRPKAGTTESIAGVPYMWQPVSSQLPDLDFSAFSRDVVTQGVAYAVCYLVSPTERKGLRLLLNTPNPTALYLDGKEVFKNLKDRMGREELEIDLAQGVNVLVYISFRRTDSRTWEGMISLSDARFEPLRDVRITLDPDAR